MPYTAAVLLHLAAAVAALAVGVLVLALRKGTPLHRRLGRIWVVVMAVVAIGSFWVRHTGHLSWIHGLSVYTLAWLAIAVWAIRTGRVKLHRYAMVGTFAGLVIAGLFALSPSRMLGGWMAALWQQI